jgi:hypothetical protein
MWEVALLTGMFTLLGVALGGFINLRIAGQSRAAQLALAEQDRVTKLALASAEARRGRREREVEGTLSLLTQRYMVYMRMHEAAWRHDQRTFDECVKGDWPATHPLTQSAWLAAEGFPDDHPILTYIQAEHRFFTFAQLTVLDQGSRADMDAALKAVREAMAAVRQAAERRIDGAA